MINIKVYIATTIIMIIDLLLYLFYRISFTGVILDKIVFWLWLLSTFYLIIHDFKKRWVKVYTGFLSLLIFLSFIPMGVPFIIIVGNAIHFENSIYVDNLRLAYTSESPLASRKIHISKRYLILEKEIGKIDLDYNINGKYYSFENVKKIRKVLPNKPGKILKMQIEFDDGVKTIFNIE